LDTSLAWVGGGERDWRRSVGPPSSKKVGIRLRNRALVMEEHKPK
jgi:hypothetical protein